VIGAYLIALGPALALAGGAVVLIEMSYRLSTQPELGTVIELFGARVDAASVWTWIAAAAAIGGGVSGLRRARPRVATAWNAAEDEVRARAVMR